MIYWSEWRFMSFLVELTSLTRAVEKWKPPKYPLFGDFGRFWPILTPVLKISRRCANYIPKILVKPISSWSNWPGTGRRINSDPHFCLSYGTGLDPRSHPVSCTLGVGVWLGFLGVGWGWGAGWVLCRSDLPFSRLKVSYTSTDCPQNSLEL